MTPGLRPGLHSHPRYRWIVLATVGAGMVMAILSSSIINIALPFITTDFTSDPVTMGWVVTIFMITQATLMPVSGRAGDIYGHKKVFIGGLVWFAATSLLCAAAWNPLSLVIGRGLQAIAASALAPMALAFVFSSFPAPARPQALGIMGGVMGSAPVLGLSLGGLLVENLSWRWIFLFNLPLCLVLVPLALLVLKESPVDREKGFDIIGALLLVTGLFCGLLGLNQGGDWGWNDPRVLGSFAVLAVLLSAFVLWERKAARPMIDPGLFRLRSLVSANIAGFFSSGAMFGVMFILPFFFQLVRGEEATAIGLELAPLALLYVLMAPVGGRLTRMLGNMTTSLIGLLIAALGYMLVARTMIVDASALGIGMSIAVIGAGLGLISAPLTEAALHDAPADKRGIASSLPNMFRFTGGSFTIAVLSSFLTWRVTVHLLGAGVPAGVVDATVANTFSQGSAAPISMVFRQALASSFQEVVLFALLFVAAAIAAVLFMPQLRHGRKP